RLAERRLSEHGEPCVALGNIGVDRSLSRLRRYGRSRHKTAGHGDQHDKDPESAQRVHDALLARNAFPSQSTRNTPIIFVVDVSLVPVFIDERAGRMVSHHHSSAWCVMEPAATRFPSSSRAVTRSRAFGPLPGATSGTGR